MTTEAGLVCDTVPECYERAPGPARVRDGRSEAGVDIYFCGTRGSTPAPGRSFVRYGGHTSCVGLARDGAPPELILDAGTGLVNLDAALGSVPFRGTLLLGHLHWDHTHGMPFFAAGARPGHRVRVLIPGQADPAEAVLARAFSPPHFPIRPGELGAGWRFGSIEPGEHTIEGFSVLAAEIPHKGGRTFGFRITHDERSVAYLSDHHPLAVGPGPLGVGELHPAALALAAGVDVLIHDAQYTAAELPDLADYGHSCPDYAVSLAEAAGARQVMLFHHAPGRTDDAIDELVAGFAGRAVPVRAASDGLTVRLPAGNTRGTGTGTTSSITSS